MKRISTLLLAVVLLSSSLHAIEPQRQILNAAQVSKLDLSGKWTGKRNQYSADKKTFVESFQYEFELKQEGDIITGTSTIISSNGEYADMQLEGVLIGNKLHFAEKAVKNAIRPDGKLWCFKSGELYFAKVGDNLKLVGATPSYMETYNYPCSGGVTDLVKVDNSANLAMLTTMNSSVSDAEPAFNLNVFPNPFVDNANVSYNLPNDAKVKTEVYDINGKLLNVLFDGNQKAGDYNLSFSNRNYNTSNGIFIVKMTVNGDVSSRQLVQMK